MALIAKAFQLGDVVGTIYTLEQAGDVFPVHEHTEADIHITIVAAGALRCTGRPSIEGKVIAAKGNLDGNPWFLDWNPGEPHGFVALTDGATLVNIRKRAAE